MQLAANWCLETRRREDTDSAATAKAGTKEPATCTVNRKASLPKPKRAKAASSGGPGNDAEATPDVAAIDARIKVAEESLKPSAERLKETVSQKVEKLDQASLTKRRNYLDIFPTTVPDPIELGLKAAEAPGLFMRIHERSVALRTRVQCPRRRKCRGSKTVIWKIAEVSTVPEIM